jgi:hypothetical protein
MNDENPEPAKPALFGIAKGRFVVPDNIDRDNDEIRRLFEEGPLFPDEPPPEAQG